MARARPPKSRRAPSARGAPRPRPGVAARREARPAPAEKTLLALARELTAAARHPPPGATPLGAALERLAAACAPGAPLAAEVRRAWLESRRDKTAALALAWAREQTRLALEEAVELTPGARRGRLPASPDTLAWLLLAACEAIAHEPPAAAADRVRTLRELTAGAGPAG